MKFWDSSAVVPLLVSEPMTGRMQGVAARDPGMFAWWGTEVECVSALVRLERDGMLDPQDVAPAMQRLGRLAASWQEIDPSDAIREAAVRFLRVHPLRAADALQLAAAFQAAEGRPTSLELVTLDHRVAAAARKEGFLVIDAASVN